MRLLSAGVQDDDRRYLVEEHEFCPVESLELAASVPQRLTRHGGLFEIGLLVQEDVASRLGGRGESSKTTQDRSNIASSRVRNTLNHNDHSSRHRPRRMLRHPISAYDTRSLVQHETQALPLVRAQRDGQPVRLWLLRIVGALHLRQQCIEAPDPGDVRVHLQLSA